MDIPQNVLDMIADSEKINVEYKETIKAVENVDIMAFANRHGGHILVGVKEITKPDGKQVGELKWFHSKDIDKDRRTIQGYADNLSPTVDLVIDQYQQDDRSWLFDIGIKEHSHKPVGTQNGRYTIRTKGVCCNDRGTLVQGELIMG